MVTNSLLYWTASLLGICRQSMPKDAKSKLIAMRDTCSSEREVWTKALDRAVQRAKAAPEGSESDESLPEMWSPEKETPKTARKKKKSSESRQTIQELQDQLRLMQIQLEEARKLNRERLENH